MSELPKGWEGTTLGDVCSKPQYGYTTKADPVLGEVKFLRTTDITKGLLNWDTVPFCMESPSESSKYQLVVGDIVIARSGSVGMSYLIDKAYEPAVFASYLIRFKPITPVLSQYVKAFLDSHLFWEQVEVNKAGNALQNINAQKLSAMSFPLAPLAEQKRIVEKLDEVLVQVDTIKARLDGIPAILKRFRQSVLASAVSGKLTEEWRGSYKNSESVLDCYDLFAKRVTSEASSTAQRNKVIKIHEQTESSEFPLNVPTSWLLKNLNKLAFGFNYGSSAKSQPSGEVPVLRMGNIQKGKLDWNDLVYTSDLAEVDKYRLLKGDVLFNRTNSPELVGKTTIYQGEREAIYAGYLIKVQGSEILDSEFINIALNSAHAKNYCMRVKTDGVSQSNINAQKLGAFPCPLPPLEEQKEIVRLVDQYFAFADTIEAQVKKAQARVDNLTQSILAKAFRGELVEQDPNDEPADKLLERIALARKEAEALAKAAKKATPKKRTTKAKTTA